MVRSFRIVPAKVAKELDLELVPLVGIQLVTAGEKFVLDCSVEPFNGAIDLGTPGIDEMVWGVDGF